MDSEKLFQAISHPLRVEMLKTLSQRPLHFSELKRKLKIKSSGLLDFHINKLKGLVTLDEEGRYTLTEEGYSALQIVEAAQKYGWQKRAYQLNLIAYIIINIYFAILDQKHLIFVLPISSIWMIFYSYWTFKKRRIQPIDKIKTNS